MFDHETQRAVRLAAQEIESAASACKSFAHLVTSERWQLVALAAFIMRGENAYDAAIAAERVARR